MAYKQVSPQVVAEGGTGVSTLTGVVTGNGTSAVTANAITQYGVLVGGASNAVSSTAVGTASQVLTSNGAGADPTFQDSTGSSGSMILLSSQTASASAAIEFKSIISATYTTYLLTISDLTPSVDAFPEMLVSSDNGATYIVTNYQSQVQDNAYTSNTFAQVNSTTFGYMPIGTIEATASWGGACEIWLFNVGNGQEFMAYGEAVWHDNTTGTLHKGFAQIRNTSTAVNAFEIILNTGTMTTGDFSLYGVAQ